MIKEVDSQQAQKLIGGITIPPQPSVLQTVLQEQASAEPNLQKLAKVISNDVSLSAGVIKTVNSPYYGLRNKVRSVQHAVMMLDTKSVMNIVTGLSLKQALPNSAKFNANWFWESATDSALISAAVAQKIPGIVDTDEAYLLGLFHDCGIPLMMMKYPEYYDVYKHAIQEPSEIITEAEEEFFKTNHAIVGYFMARSWQLPDEICQAILVHHEPSAFEEDQTTRNNRLAILHVASYIVNRQHRMTVDYDWERMQEWVLSHLDIGSSELQELAEDVGELVEMAA